MATLTIQYATSEREQEYWVGKDLTKLLPRLGELIRFMGDLYTAIEHRDLDVTRVNIQIKDSGQWRDGGGYQSRIVAFVVAAPQGLLDSLLSCPEFCEEFLD